MTNRKGMSDVVTTVLVILLVVVAIGIIWVFVQKPVQKAGTQVEKATACAGVELQLLSCQKVKTNTGTVANPALRDDINASVKVAQGSVFAVQFIVDQSSGTTKVYEADKVTGTVPTTLNRDTLTIIKGKDGATDPVKISAMPVVKTNDGTEVVCAELAKVTCS